MAGWSPTVGLLVGDGWTAGCSGSRPRTGQMQMMGELWSLLHTPGAPAGTVRGQVCSVDVVTEQQRRHQTSMHVDPASVQLGFRAVNRAPRSYMSPVAEQSADPDGYVDDVRERGVRVVLDLDDVPGGAEQTATGLREPAASRLRPRLVPGDVSTAAGRWWVCDEELPVVAQFDLGGPIRETVLPGTIGARRVWAMPTGCWVTGDDGVFLLDLEGGWIRVDDTPVVGAAGVDGMVLVWGRAGRWALLRTDGPAVVEHGPAGDLIDVIACSDGFAALNDYDTSRPDLELLWLTEIDRGANAVTTLVPAPAGQVGGRGARLLADPLRIVDADIVHEVGPEQPMAPERRAVLRQVTVRSPRVEYRMQTAARAVRRTADGWTGTPTATATVTG